MDILILQKFSFKMSSPSIFSFMNFYSISTEKCYKKYFYKLKHKVCPARWLSWLKHHPIPQKTEGLNPGQGTSLAFRFGPQPGPPQAATTRCFSLISVSIYLSLYLSIDLSISISISISLSVKSMNISSSGDYNTGSM